MTNVFGGWTSGVRMDKPGGDYVSKAELAQKANRASGAKLGNIASLTSDGDLADSGLSAANVVSEEYVDSSVSMRLLKTGDAMSGKLNMSGRQIINLGDPEAESDAATHHM